MSLWRHVRALEAALAVRNLGAARLAMWSLEDALESTPAGMEAAVRQQAAQLGEDLCGLELSRERWSCFRRRVCLEWSPDREPTDALRYLLRLGKQAEGSARMCQCVSSVECVCGEVLAAAVPLGLLSGQRTGLEALFRGMVSECPREMRAAMRSGVRRLKRAPLNVWRPYLATVGVAVRRAADQRSTRELAGALRGASAEEQLAAARVLEALARA